jgi:hypothetical protein
MQTSAGGAQAPKPVGYSPMQHSRQARPEGPCRSRTPIRFTGLRCPGSTAGRSSILAGARIGSPVRHISKLARDTRLATYSRSVDVLQTRLIWTRVNHTVLVKVGTTSTVAAMELSL